MVEDLKKILSILKENSKPVWLFASLKMDEFVDKWSLIISAPWINNNNENEEYKNVLDIIKKNLDSEKLSSIARVVFLSKDDHLIQELLKKDKNTEIKNEKINGNVIHFGFIIESDSDLQWKENRNLKLNIDKP
jgi:hypothetical protein